MLRSKKYKSIRILSWLLTAVMFITAPYSICFADEYDDKITSMQNQEKQTQEMISNLEKQTQATKDSIAMLQEQRKETENNVSELKDISAELQNEIEGYSGRLDALDGEIEMAESAMSEVSAQIVSLNGELQDIRQKKTEREELLRKRIKNVYEKGGSSGMLQNILGASSLKDILNRYEYVDAMIRYDRQKIAECKALEEELSAKVAEVEAKEDELNAYQEHLDDKYTELESLSDEVRGKLNSTNSSISAEAGKLKDYDSQLAALDKTMKSLESQTAAAQAQLAKQIAARLAMKKEDTSGSYAASASELEWLAATIQAEAGGESYTGKLAVGSVIMNRVKSSAFPNNVVGVITQNMQFASYRSGKVELIISKGPNSACINAAQEVLDGARVGDYLFFMTKYYADYYGISEYDMIGNHAFFYRWVVKEKPPVEEQQDQDVQEAPQEQPQEQEQEQPQEEAPADQNEQSGEDESEGGGEE